MLVEGALSLSRQVGAASLKDSLVEPPLRPPQLPLAITAVWSLCHSYSSINRCVAGAAGAWQVQQVCGRCCSINRFVAGAAGVWQLQLHQQVQQHKQVRGRCSRCVAGGRADAVHVYRYHLYS